MSVDVTLAERFVLANARLLERHRAARLLRSGSIDPILAALRAYRNADGGFQLLPAPHRFAVMCARSTVDKHTREGYPHAMIPARLPEREAVCLDADSYDTGRAARRRPEMTARRERTS